MKKIVMTIVILLSFGCFFYAVPFVIKSNAVGQHTTVFSPLPNFLNRMKNAQVSTMDLFLPSIIKAEVSGKDEPQISAKAALMYDLTTGQTLYEKNTNERLPMASLTKIMTAIIAMENKKSDDRYLVEKQALVGEDAMGLLEGEVLSLEELMYGLVLHSGNDAAEVLADNYSSGRSGFIKAMNDKAQALGLTDTNFTNPTGLEGDGDQYTTAYDLLVMTDYALSNFPLFAKVAATQQIVLPASASHQEYDLQNETNLVGSYPGVEGVKTGYTPEAGLCLVTYLNYKGHQIIGILLGSDDRRGEMKELLDYSLHEEGITPPPHS